MAEPQMPQGVTPLPPGVVSMDDALNAQAGLSVRPQRPVVSQAYEDYVASPLTQIASRLLPQNPFQMPGSFDPSAPSEGPAKMVVPQNLTEAAIAAATLGAGGLAAKAGCTGLAAGATRVAGATAGGMAGKALQEGDVSAGTLAKGGAQGLVAGLTGEGIGAGISQLRKMGMERASAKMSQIDAAEVGQAFKQIPKLKGVFNDVPATPEGIENLVNGAVPDPKIPGRTMSVGEAKLGAFMDQADARIAQAIEQKAQQGIQVRFPLVQEPAGSFGTFEQARSQLTKLGSASKKMNPNKEYIVGDVKMSGAQAKQLYAESLRAFREQLTRVGPEAVTAFNESRGAYEAGMKLLKELPKAFEKMTYNRVAFNSDALHKPLAKNRSDWMNKLGEDGYWTLAKALRITPETIGRKDVMSPTGSMATLAGVMPIPGAAYMRFQVGSPGFVGDPLRLGQGARLGLDLAASQGLGRGLDLAGPMAQQYGPLMLPGAQP